MLIKKNLQEEIVEHFDNENQLSKQELQIKLLISNIKKLENLVDDLIDNLDSKRKKVEYLKEKIAFNIKEIDKIIQKYNADS